MRTKISWKRNSTVIEVLAAAALLAASCLRQTGASGALFALRGGGAAAINLGQSYPLLGMALSAVLLLEKACWKDGRMEKKRKRSIGF